ncbi:MAG: type II toxin-antitoxin system VapC family toxin [Paludibacter sp.]|nr:type II toxin-antitoxin system VapC family toxin [Paludibacter sp.]
MRYLIDTNIFLYLTTDVGLLDSTVKSILDDYENILYISCESVKELILFYRKQKNKRKYWKDETEMVLSIEKILNIKILPVKKEHLLTYARLEINKAQDHNDPSDHIIISQAITEEMPLISSDQKFQFYTKQKLDFINNAK